MQVNKGLVSQVSQATTSRPPASSRPNVAEIETKLHGMAVRDAVFPVSMFFGLYYIGAAVAHQFMQQGLALQIFPPICLLTSVLFFVTAYKWRREAPSLDVIVGWFTTVIAVNNSVVLGVTGQGDAFFAQLINQIGLGLVGVSWRAFFGRAV